MILKLLDDDLNYCGQSQDERFGELVMSWWCSSSLVGEHPYRSFNYTREYMDCSRNCKKRGQEICISVLVQDKTTGMMRNVDLSKALPSKNIFKHFSV